MAYFAMAQASDSNTTHSLQFYLCITSPMNLKANSAFSQPILFGEVTELSVPFMHNQPQRTKTRKTKRKVRKEERKILQSGTIPVWLSVILKMLRKPDFMRSSEASLSYFD